jgi:hypothetical protein
MSFVPPLRCCRAWREALSRDLWSLRWECVSGNLGRLLRRLNLVPLALCAAAIFLRAVGESLGFT